MHEDIERIKNCYNDYYQEKFINRIEKVIMNLVYMPRIYKTLISSKDKDGEYRRMISGNYSVIYKIDNGRIIILRIFNQKENYLNQKRFILKEDSPQYIINKRRKIEMVKFRILKNSYAKLKESYFRIITGEEVWSKSMDRIIEEAEESLKNEGYITLEEWREHMRRDYNIAL